MMPVASRSNSIPETELELSWFHGKIDRQEAERILLDEGNENGLFLVRESPGINGAYILSVIQEGSPKHYQITQHGDDAFFSIEDGYIVHGLDVLISLCWKHCSGSIGPLTRPVKKDLPPLETRQHGRCNLLHRSTKEGNSTVVAELLRCGYRSLEAKNQDGQTAVHVAAIQGNEEILKLLVQAGANVNIKDNLELTPLHYACKHNHVACLRILLQAGANSQLRQRTTGWLALHEAACRGHIDCVKFLLAMCVPSLPRTNEDETPADLARKSGFYQCARVLELYQPPLPFTRREDWYHGSISRAEAERRLRKGSTNHSEESFYLIRKSSRKPGFFALSMLYVDKVFHFEVGKRGQYYFIDYGPYLDSLEHVVEHYMNNSDGLPTSLQRPIRPLQPVVEDSVTITPKSRHQLTPPALPSRNASRTSSPQNVKPQESNNNGQEENILTVASDTIVGRIQKEDIELWDVLGEGEFGSVYRGSLRLPGSKSVPVAVKTLREEQVNSCKDEFLREATVMMELEHPFIVKFITLCEGPPLMMVEELVPLGSLLDYLLDHPDNISPAFELKLWAAQIAHGMQYLELRRFVHRDLAARNILLASRYQIKISDFGLSRALKAGENYYTASKGGRWPVKWYAPESVNYGTFSHASDVWSYGVTLWEMFSFGAQPYGDLPGVQVIQLVENGTRLPRPEHCPEETYSFMLRCWSRDPYQRPSFSQLVEYFASSSEYANVQTLTIEGSFGSTIV